MCEFVSWIELDGMVYFLDDNKLNTKEGREILKTIPPEDITGHGAIRAYYPELKGRGKDYERTDFSDPRNFPPEIVDAIKSGLLEHFGTCSNILTQPARAKCEEIERPALAKYEEIQRPAWAKYKEIERPARAKYEEIERPALAKYEEIQRPAWAEYEEIQRPAWAKYEEIERQTFWEIARIKENRRESWQ